MKIRPSAGVLIAFVVTLAVILTFLYGVPSGRHMRREALRVFRVARNATGIYPEPVLTIKRWRDTGQGVLLVEVYGSGRLVVSRRGDRIDRKLTRDASARLVERGQAAFGDFSSGGCGTERGGLNSQLYVLRDGAWMGSTCRDGPDRPRGSESRRLFADIERHVPGAFDGVSRRQVYDESADARAAVEETIAEARSDRKRVLLVFGANWCAECIVLDARFHEEPAGPLLEANFHVVHIDIGRGLDRKNGDLAAKYGIPLDKGIPAVAVLESDGTLLHSQKDGEWAPHGLSSTEVVEFLNRWKRERTR